MFLSVGSNIRDISAPLQKVTPEYLYNALRNPRPEMDSRIRQLRIIRQLNEKQYASLKSQLPYIVCASFNPPFRKTENFAFTQHFIIDIDHICAKGLVLNDIKAKISSDSRTMLCFVSPGEDGLKVIMRLSERCYDAGVYSVFYKRFIQKFSRTYGLEQVIDSKTSDVARACFMSVDREAFFNPECEPVNMGDFVNLVDTSELLRQKKEQERIDAQKSDSQPAAREHIEPEDDAMAKIRQLLNAKQPKQKAGQEVYVPEILNRLEAQFKESIAGYGFATITMSNIQYGKKIQAEVGLKKAEVNLFYGKRGFTVVKSPRSGTDATLNGLLADTVNTIISEL